MKRFEKALEAIEWYQNESGYEPVLCPHDGVPMVGEHRLGNVYIYCPHCDHRKYSVPDFIMERHSTEFPSIK